MQLTKPLSSQCWFWVFLDSADNAAQQHHAYALASHRKQHISIIICVFGFVGSCNSPNPYLHIFVFLVFVDSAGNETQQRQAYAVASHHKQHVYIINYVLVLLDHATHQTLIVIFLFWYSWNMQAMRLGSTRRTPWQTTTSNK